jgi:hypothetical protein
MNPGPSDSDLSSSFGSISSTSTTVNNFIHNSVSFLHLNIQSITPKLMIMAWVLFNANQLIGLVHPKIADCYWGEYKMFHIYKYFLFLIFISSHIHSKFPICRSGLCLQLIWSFTKTITPPPILPTLFSSFEYSKYYTKIRSNSRRILLS